MSRRIQQKTNDLAGSIHEVVRRSSEMPWSSEQTVHVAQLSQQLTALAAAYGYERMGEFVLAQGLRLLTDERRLSELVGLVETGRVARPTELDSGKGIRALAEFWKQAGQL